MNDITITDFNREKGLTRKSFFKSLFLITGLAFLRPKKESFSLGNRKYIMQFETTKNILIPIMGNYEINVYQEFIQIIGTLKNKKGKLLTKVASRALIEKDLSSGVWLSECDKLTKLAIKQVNFVLSTPIEVSEVFPKPAGSCLTYIKSA